MAKLRKKGKERLRELSKIVYENCIELHSIK